MQNFYQQGVYLKNSLIFHFYTAVAVLKAGKVKLCRGLTLE